MMFCCPHPEETVNYVLGVASKSSQRGIEEWLPTSPANYAGVMFLASVGLVMAAVGLAKRRLEPTEALLLVAFALLACRAQRMVIWWALVMPGAIGTAGGRAGESLAAGGGHERGQVHVFGLRVQRYG